MADKEVFHFVGGFGDVLCVYEDRVVIQHQGVANIIMGGFKGDKTIYYSDITSLQYKKPSTFSGTGYIQFSLPGGIESTRGGYEAMGDENSIKVRPKAADEAEKVVAYINNKIREAKRGGSIQAALSPADELKKFKELLDMGIISQDEFEAKKKQILNN